MAAIRTASTSCWSMRSSTPRSVRILQVPRRPRRRCHHQHRRRRARRGDDAAALRQDDRLQTGRRRQSQGHDRPYRTPETQREFAAKYGQDAAKVTSFADGTKLSMEATILANATGFRVGRRGMYGPQCAACEARWPALLPAERCCSTAAWSTTRSAPSRTPARLSSATRSIRRNGKELAYYKMGDGPFYVFYTPYHLPHIQIAVDDCPRRALQRRDRDAARRAGCEVATVAKRDLKAGEIARRRRRIHDLRRHRKRRRRSPPRDCCRWGCLGDAALLRNVPQDSPIAYADVALPDGRLCDRLRAEQAVRFGVAGPASRSTVA